jgi:uncharacterized protein YndB with AHSA1/START domain
VNAQATDLTIRKSVTVNAPIEHAFEVFTEGISSWWPLKTHSIKEDLADEVVFETKPAGRIYERWHGGNENWGEVLAWEPPRRVVFSWHPGHDPASATEIEVRFSEDGGATRVELEHRGWERLEGRAQEARAGYDGGWDAVLTRYAEAASS